MELDNDSSGTLSMGLHPSTIPFFKRVEWRGSRHLKIKTILQRTLNCRDPTGAQCAYSRCSVARNFFSTSPVFSLLVCLIFHEFCLTLIFFLFVIYQVTHISLFF